MLNPKTTGGNQMQFNDTNSKTNVKPKNILKKLVHDRNFTIIDNSLLRNPKLSLKAKGLACFLLSLPDDWIIIISELTKHCKDGEDGIRSALKELASAGYTLTIKHRDANGKIRGWQTLIREDLNIPFSSMAQMDSPDREKPDLAKPDLANPTLLSTNDTKDEFNQGLNIAHLENAPLKKNDSEILTSEIFQLFERLWSMYPLKKSKQNALLKFNNIIRKEPKAKQKDLIAAIVSGLNACLDEWKTKKQLKEQGADIFVAELPYLSTWLHNKRWEDDYQNPTEILNSAQRKRGIIDIDQVFAGAI